MVSAPALGTRWSAYRGEGAFRDGKKIQVSKIARLSESMIFTTGTGSKKDADGPGHVTPSRRRGKKQPRAGRLLATHAGCRRRHRSGRGLDLHAMGLGATGLIVEEAGGKSTDLHGERTIYGGNFVSTNGKIHDEVLGLLQ